MLPLRLALLLLATAVAAEPDSVLTVGADGPNLVDEIETDETSSSATATADISTSGTYSLNVALYVKEERRAEFLECIKANQKGTLNDEPLALQYDWGESATERNTFHFHEQYQGKAGFEAHTQAPHFKAWEVFAGSDPFTKDPEVQFFEVAAKPPKARRGWGRRR